MSHALPGGCRGPPQQVGCGWGASPGIGGAAPPRWVCMWPASWAGVLQCTLHSLHRMRSARGAWSPWSFTAWMRRYAAVVKPIGGGGWDGGWGQPGGDPRDRAVLLGWGHPPHMALSSSHHILGRLGPTTPLGHSPSLSLGPGWSGAHFLILMISRDLPPSLAHVPHDRTLLPSFLKG